MLKKATIVLVTILLVSGTVAMASYPDGVYIGNANGHNGPIQVEVTVFDGQITDITVIMSEETPIISDTAFSQVSQAIMATQDFDVESVTGATISSKAMVRAVEDALSNPGFRDGTYEVTTNGHNGPVSFRIVVTEGRIAQIDVLESEETPIISDAAFREVSKAIIATQSTDVNTVTGATISSRAMIGAVNNALRQPTESAVLVLTDGEFEGTAQGFNGPVSVRVYVQEGEITEIIILEETETPGLGDAAIDIMVTRVIEAQGVEVDTVSGATFSSGALVEAVEDALQ